jgi:hypothetical protein
MHEARDFPRGLPEQSGHLPGMREISVQLLVLAAQ